MRPYKIRKFRGSLMHGWTVQRWDREISRYVNIGIVPNWVDTIRIIDYRERQLRSELSAFPMEQCS